MSSEDVTTYSADKVMISLAGRRIDSGFAEGEFLSIERDAPRFTRKTGADGAVTRSKNLNRGATAKLKLMQTSLGNDVLAALVALGESSDNGADVGDFLVQDMTGGMLVRADKAWVEKEPVVGRGAESGETEWTIALAHAEFTPAGNPTI
jgi:hypothetical protein